MLENIKTPFKDYCDTLETTAQKIAFVDKMLKFYADYIEIINQKFDEMGKSLEDEYEDKKDDLPVEVCVRFDEKLTKEIESSKKEEETKIRDVIDWLLEQRTEFSKNV